MKVLTAESVSRPKKILVFEGIQVLRFVAALLVVITHSTFYASERLLPGSAFWNDGASGVDIFFVISGFVMYLTSENLGSKQHGWFVFLVRRIIRIVPMYWVATTVKLIFLVVVPSAVYHASFSLLYIFLSYFFIPAYNYDGQIRPLLGVGWTLYFEMFFYVLFCASLYVDRSPIKFVGIILLICASVSMLKKPGWPAIFAYFDPIVLEFLFGMLIGKLSRRGKFLAAPIASLFVLVGFTMIISGLNDYAFVPIPAIASATLIVYGIVSLERFISGRIPIWVLYLGEASYVLYLFHPIFGPLPPTLLSIAGFHLLWFSVASSVLLALGASCFIHSYVEKPITAWVKIKLGNRFLQTV